MKKCKNCKEAFEPRFKTTEKYCWKDECKSVEIDIILKKKREKQRKDWNKHKAERKPVLYPQKYKKLLQSQINLLARKIDAHFNYLCIDCGKPYGKQIDAAHLHNSQGNENIRYNLHNLHSAKSDCNQFSSEHKVGYRIGIEERYGKEYLNYIDNELPLEYEYLGLLNTEVAEKLAIVRKINREFDSIVKDLELNSIEMRSYFNGLIGIYKNKLKKD